MTAERVTIKSTDRGCHIQNPGEGTCWSVVYRCIDIDIEDLNETTTIKGTSFTNWAVSSTVII